MLNEDQILQIVLAVDSIILHFQFYITNEQLYLILGLSSAVFHAFIFILQQIWKNEFLKLTLNIIKLVVIIMISFYLYQTWMIYIGVQIVCIIKLNSKLTRIMIFILFCIHLIYMTFGNLDYLATGIVRNCLHYFLLLTLFNKQTFTIKQGLELIKQVTPDIFIVLDNSFNPENECEQFEKILKEQVLIFSDDKTDRILTHRESITMGLQPNLIDDKQIFEFKEVFNNLKRNKHYWQKQTYDTLSDSMIIVQKILNNNKSQCKIPILCKCCDQSNDYFYLLIKRSKIVVNKNNSQNNNVQQVDQTKEMIKTISKVSHDMRTPLNAIINMQLCLKDQIDQSLTERYLKPSLNSCRLLLNLVNDLLDQAQLQNNKIRLVFRKFNLKRLIEKTIQIFDIQKEKKELEIILNYGNTSNQIPYYINSDKNRIRQVIMNLLSNAVKYSIAKGKVEINCDFQKFSQTFQISVTDNGLGIKPVNLKNLFQEFAKVDDKENREKNPNGIGLGLLISNELAKLLSANNEGIQVQSLYGSGSTFTFSILNQKYPDEDLSQSLNSEVPVIEMQQLPESHFFHQQSSFKSKEFAVAVRQVSYDSYQGIALNNNQNIKKYNLRLNSSNLLSSNRLLPFAIDNEKTYQRKSTTQSNRIIEQANNWMEQTQKQPPVLIVDDNEFNIVVLQYILEQLYLSCDSAISGYVALKKCKERALSQYKVIFLDIEMPEMDGIETATKLLELDSSLKIVACTGNRQTPEQLETYKKVGMYGAIEKPVQKNTLRDLLSKLSEEKNDVQFSHYF